ncbi:hypothetical protein HA402_015599 [Bradysia odoriphaga]|nr:hypothetical protein HA402_015599 [Bradysia odoriphaga]
METLTGSKFIESFNSEHVEHIRLISSYEIALQRSQRVNNYAISFIINIFLSATHTRGLFDNTEDTSSIVFRYAASVANRKLADSQMKFDPEPIKIPYGNEFAASNSLCKLLQLGVSAVFGPSAPSSASHCMHICDAKEIPYIDIKWDADTKPPVVNMYPHPDAIANIFIDLVREWDWKGFTIVYESASWLKRDAELLKLYGPKEYTVTVRRINAGLDKTNYRAVLRRVKLSRDTNILLDCSIEALPEVLKQRYDNRGRCGRADLPPS